MGINGVWIDGKHSWKDYQLWLTRRPKIATAEPKLKLVEIPGADGDLDYTEAIDGTVKYNNREIVVEFTAFREVDKQAETIARLRGAWHGRTIQLEFDEEPGWVYTGRGNVQISDRTPHVMHITLTVLAEPFAIDKYPTEILLATDSTLIRDTRYYTVPHQTTEKQDSLWQFANGVSPYADFDFFDGLTAYWEVLRTKNPNPLVQLWIKDSDGNDYYINSYYNSGKAEMNLAVAKNSGIDLTKVWRIRMEGVPNAYLQFSKSNCEEVVVRDVSAVIMPQFTSTFDAPCEIYCNGYYKFPAGGAQTPKKYYGEGLILKPGDNHILISPQDVSTGKVVMWYNDKRL